MYRICIIIVLAIASGATPAEAQNISFDILEGRDHISIPFTYRHNFIIVEVELFGIMPLSFIFDTGAENTMLLTREFADLVNVQYDLRIPILGSDMTQKVYALVARSVEVELAGLPSQRRDILVMEENDINLGELTGIPIHGILGGSFFKNTVVEIDYKKQRLIFHNADSFRKPGNAYHQLPIQVSHNKPYTYVRATLLNGDSVDLKLLIDTGAGLPILLHNNSHESLVLPEEHILGRLGIGLGGLIEGYVGRIESVDVGGIRFEQVLTSFHDLGTTIMENSEISRNGVIGNMLLSRMKVMIDYVREVVYLKPRKRHSRTFKMDRGGLIVVATGVNLDEYMIKEVISDSPAEEAGLKAGDRISKLQGIQAGSFSLDHISRILQKKEGKRIRMVIERGGERLKFEFRLRKLI